MLEKFANVKLPSKFFACQNHRESGHNGVFFKNAKLIFLCAGFSLIKDGEGGGQVGKNSHNFLFFNGLST